MTNPRTQLTTANGQRTADQKTAIVLSAGYFGFFAHAGFMRAVEEAGIEYCAIAGSSAGAIVAALHASGVAAAEIIETLLTIRKKDFWDNHTITALLGALFRKGRGFGGLLKGQRFERLIARQLRVKTFAECERRLYLTAFNLTRGVDETFTTGTIADKVRASCSYPFLMTPRTIDGCDYWDGGFLAKTPCETLVEREQPDRLIIHYLPTRADERSLHERNWTAFAMLEKALTAARLEIDQHRLRALGEMQEKIVWIEPQVPPLSPDKLSQGGAAIEAAYQFGRQQLAKINAE
ncbi:MAG: patatin-like phospholipase family protein [Acidobacteria bacterium]|nr:patatin-like phospholipase family protein [Acidobacteriota bacterium]